MNWKSVFDIGIFKKLYYIHIRDMTFNFGGGGGRSAMFKKKTESEK
jgi:hypothetical protein